MVQHGFSDDLVDHTIELWASRYGHELSRDDAREILENTVGFLRVLLRWDRETWWSDAAETVDDCSYSSLAEEPAP